MISFKRVKIVPLIFRPIIFCNAIIVLLLLPLFSRGQNFQCQWAHAAGNAAMTTAYSQDVDSSGDVVITGTYMKNDLSFDNSAIILSPNSDTTVNKLFLTKYDSNGTLLWAKSYESSGHVENPVVTIDDQYNIYLTGYFYDSITFGSLTLMQNPSSPYISAFIAKFDSSGQVLWAKQISSLSSVSCKVSHDGHIALYGAFLEPSVMLGNNLTLTNSDNSGQTTDFLIAEMDHNGNLLWVKSGGVSGKNEEIDDVAFTQDDQIYVSGLFESTFTLGGITLSSTGNTSWDAKDWFLARYDINGNVPWAIRGGISRLAPFQLKDGALQIKTDQFNNLYFLGLFHSSTVQVDSLTLNGVGTLSDFISTNIFDAYWYAGMCNEKGLLWAKSGNSPVQEIYFTPAHDMGLYLTGMFGDTAAFGNITLTSTGPGSQNPEGFVVKLDNEGQVSWAKHFGPLVKHPSILDIVVDQQNTLDILGAYGDPRGIVPNLTLNFDSFALNSVSDSRDYFLARYKDNGDVLSASNIGSPEVDGLALGMLNLAGRSGLYVSGGYGGAPLTLDTITNNFPVTGWNNYFVAKYIGNETATNINLVKHTNALSVFPNPTTGVLYLHSLKGLNNIWVFNVTGREIFHQALEAPQKEYTLNLNRFADGIYWLKIREKGDDVIRKIVLMK